MSYDPKSGRRYDREFKKNAVDLVLSGRTIAQVARDLHVSSWSLGNWVRTARAGTSFTEPKSIAAETDEQRELRRLRQEVAYLQEQREILKKACGILSAGMLPDVLR